MPKFVATGKPRRVQLAQTFTYEEVDALCAIIYKLYSGDNVTPQLRNQATAKLIGHIYKKFLGMRDKRTRYEAGQSITVTKVG